ncbi:MAG: hypothetical protein WD894_10535 [Pirellulales bacterium]
MPLFETVTDLYRQADVLRRRPYGVIEMLDGRFHRVLLRPLPKYVSLFEALFWGSFCHRRVPGNRLRLFYNQPRQHSNYLSLKYAVSSRDTSLATMLGALEVLDEIARIKQSDAILTDAANFRISERFLRRQGWERHTKARYHRNFIKRFYGEFPAVRRIELAKDQFDLETAGYEPRSR